MFFGIRDMLVNLILSDDSCCLGSTIQGISLDRCSCCRMSLAFNTTSSLLLRTLWAAVK